MERRQQIATMGSLSLLALLGFAAFFQQNFRTIQVQGNSMLPTFKNGAHLLTSSAYWLVGPIQKGDIVVLIDDSGTAIIKRVYGMEGDKVDWLNVPEDYNLSSGEYVVPEQTLYVLGDNREVSEDSRRFGPVPYDRIIGKVVLKRWL